jgi:ABC-2 type transport system ATP-binding protein
MTPKPNPISALERPAVDTPALETHRLGKRYGRKLALHDFTLTLPRGGIHAVVGSNGAGKSTLFRILLGFVEPSWGESRVLGCDSRTLSPTVRGRIGLVHEEHTLPSWMSVGALTAMQRAQYPRWDDAAFHQVLDHFDVLPEQRVAQLSRGERAGLNLALTLGQAPELLILDEPTLGLDVVARQAFLESILFVGASDARTVVYCSHQMDEVERVADTLVVLERGELASVTSPEELCRRIVCWVGTFVDRPAPTPAALPGLLHSREIDGEHHLMILDPDDGLPDRLRELGASGLRRQGVGFDRAVNAYLTRHHDAPAPSEGAN